MTVIPPNQPNLPPSIPAVQMTLSAMQASRANAQPAKVQSVLEIVHPNEPELHDQVVLPGAKRAITQAELVASPLTISEVVRKINADFDDRNAARMADFDAWTDELEREKELRAHRERIRAMAIARFQAQIMREEEEIARSSSELRETGSASI